MQMFVILIAECNILSMLVIFKYFQRTRFLLYSSNIPIGMV